MAIYTFWRTEVLCVTMLLLQSTKSLTLDYWWPQIWQKAFHYTELYETWTWSRKNPENPKRQYTFWPFLNCRFSLHWAVGGGSKYWAIPCSWLWLDCVCFNKWSTAEVMLGQKRPYGVYLVLWNTHSWIPEPPCKKMNYPEATMLWVSPSHMERLHVSTPGQQSQLNAAFESSQLGYQLFQWRNLQMIPHL